MSRSFLFTIVLLICSCLTGYSEDLEEIKNFYKKYMINVLEYNSNNETLCKTYMTDEMISKVQRMGNASGGNPIIRAQDMNSDAIKTLDVRKISDDWYMVSYLWKEKDSTTLTEIPLKVKHINGKCKIAYITPIENGIQYGDELLSHLEDTIHYETDNTSEKSFIESFYKSYTATYCSMSKDMDQKLSELRLSNMSEKALEQFKNAEEESLYDGLLGYDILINNFDFDCMWFKSLKITELSSNKYLVTYQAGNHMLKINIRTEYRDGRYFISNISV